MARMCVITQNPRWGGGVLTKLTAFLRYAASRNHICDLYFPTDGTYPEAEVESLRSIGSVDRAQAIPLFEKVPDFVRSASFGRRCTIPSVYEAYVLVSGSLYQGMPFANQRLPYVAYIAGTHKNGVMSMPRTALKHYLIYNPLTNYMARRQEMLCGAMAKIVAVDSRCASQEVQDELGLSQDKVSVIPPAADLNEFQPGEPVVEPRRYLLSVAQLGRRKDFPTLFKAFRRVVDCVKDVELRVVGEGKEKQNLEKIVEQLRLQDHVRFLGHLPKERLIEQYRGASLFTLASIHETFGIVFLEAMAHRLPVVATDSGGPADLIAHGETGFLSPVGDWRSLSECMLRVLEDPVLARRLGGAGRKKAVEEFSFEAVFQQLDGMFAEAFDLHPAASSVA